MPLVPFILASLLRLLWLVPLTSATVAVAEDKLTVLSFNIWGGGLNDNTSIDATAAVLKATNADIVGLQEVRAESQPCKGTHCPPDGVGVGVALAQALGYYHHAQEAQNDALWANAILSRYPIVAVSPNQLGVRLQVAEREVVLFNIHATDYPYQPYQLLRIPYDDAPYLETAAQAVQAARRARQTALDLLRAELPFAQDADLVIVTGDFNEPSGRDWTPRAAAAGRHPLSVAWPLTAAIEGLGFTDAYRVAHPDEIEHPGFTWSPLLVEEDPGDHADRIDYVFLRGAQLRVRSAKVIGERSERADVVITPWPSDHRAVLADVQF